ncbi:MAG: polymer-forming cytoskeletal protein [Alkalispirochaeta sp.]
MAELRIRTIDESELDTVLASDIEFEGTVEFSRPLLIKGVVNGTIKTESDLYISDSAQVNADISAGRVSVKGTIRGDVDASERIELFSGATIVGNIASPDLIIQSGSHFTGKCVMPGADGTLKADGALRTDATPKADAALRQEHDEEDHTGDNQ